VALFYLPNHAFDINFSYAGRINPIAPEGYQKINLISFPLSVHKLEKGNLPLRGEDSSLVTWIS